MSSTPAAPGPPANRTAPPASPANSSSPSSPAPASSAPPSLPPPPTPSAPPPSSGAPATPSTTPPATPGTPTTPSPPLGTPSPPAERSTPAGTPPAPASPPPSNSWLTTPLVVGIAVGGLVVVLLASLLCVCLFKKKKKHHPHPPPPPHLLHYYGHPLPPPPPPPPPYKGDHYGGVYQNWQHNAPPPPPDHVVKMHSHPSPPSPPPPLNVNSQNSSGSGSNYSGGESQPPPSPGTALGFSRCTFTYEDLVAATNGFSDANLLGRGGFGYVHKGVLPNGTEVAVKQLRVGSVQGEREFQAEVEIISRVHHKHIVTLVGYCISGGKRLLVYEFVPNNTLECHLHGRGRPTMEWPARLRIALGTAKGLAYLHEDCHPKIIHRDIKAANILLDFRFEAKVGDFGFAKLTTDNNTHVSTRIMGTIGYVAPEYASSGKLTEKSDVFSFGVLLLELITGRRPVSSRQTYMDDSLVHWAWPLMTRAFEDGNHDALVDPWLGKEFNANEMARMIACAAACVRHSARRRPRMSQVVRALEGDVSLDDLNEGVRPGHSRFLGSYSSSDYDTGQYNEDLKKFSKMAFGSTGFQSSQQTSTSEYGQNPSVTSSDGHQTQEMEMEMEMGSTKKDGDNVRDSQAS